MDELRSLAETGSGVKAMKAKAELEQMRVRSQTGANMAEVRAAWKTRKAKKDLEKGDPMAEEMKRVRCCPRLYLPAARLRVVFLCVLFRAHVGPLGGATG